MSPHVKKEYRNSTEFRASFEKALDEPIDHWLRSELHEEFRSHSVYATKTFENYTDHFVDIRGKLHHHSSKNPNTWDPNQPGTFTLDAAVMGHIAYSVVFIRAFLFLEEPDVISSYEKQEIDYVEQYV